MQKNKMRIMDAAFLDEKIWFCVNTCNCLFSIDIATRERQVYMLPDESKFLQGYAYVSMVACGRKIYLIPFWENSIMQFDIDTKMFDEISINYRMPEGEKGMVFYGGNTWGKYVFMANSCMPVILRLNTDNNHIDYIDGWYGEIKDKIFAHNEFYCREHSIVINNNLYVPLCNANAILKVNCESLETSVYKLGDEKKGYSGVGYDGHDLWLSPRKGKSIVQWNEESGEVCRFHAEHYVDNEKIYTNVICDGKKKILFPMLNVEELRDDTEKIYSRKGMYSFAKEEENYILFYEINSAIMTLVDKQSKNKIELQIMELEEVIPKMMEMQGEIIVEDSNVTIEHFMKKILE